MLSPIRIKESREKDCHMDANTSQVLSIIQDKITPQIQVKYTPKTERTVYDICDFNGRILMTGDIQEQETEINLKGLINDQYILMVLDGDMIYSKTFKLGV